MLAYIAYHFYKTRIQVAFYGVEPTYQFMVESLSRPAVITFYVLGITSAAFHFANGLWAFLIGWGLTGFLWATVAALGAFVLATGLTWRNLRRREQGQRRS